MGAMTIERPAVPEPDSGPFRVRMDLAYDGAPFSGWAAQPGLLTVQGVLEDALEVLLRRPVRVTVAGRTDAGVHARGQVVHFDLTGDEWASLARGRDLDPGVSLRRRLHGVMNRDLTLPGRAAGLPRRSAEALAGAVEILSAAPAPAGFDARFSALWRRYSYRIADLPRTRDPLTRHATLWYKSPLDTGAMNEAAASVLGIRDFLSFCKPRLGATTIRELQEFTFRRGRSGHGPHPGRCLLPQHGPLPGGRVAAGRCGGAPAPVAGRPADRPGAGLQVPAGTAASAGPGGSAVSLGAGAVRAGGTDPGAARIAEPAGVGLK